MWKNFLAALRAGTWAPALNSVVVIAVTVGVITSAQASAVTDAVTDVVTGVASLVSIVITAVHAFKGVQLIKAKPGPDGAFNITSKQ